MTIDERREEIVREVAALLPQRRVREPWMFTAGDVAAESGRFYPRVMDELQRMVERGTLRMDRRGFDPATGRHVILFWRPEDDPNDLPI